MRSGAVATGLTLVLLLTLPVSGNEDAGSEFCEFVFDFVDAWEAKDLATLNGLVNSSTGFWVVYNFGVERQAFRFLSIHEPLASEPHGFGYLAGVGFGECHPERGSLPRCDGGAIREPLCRFGKVTPTFLEVVEAAVAGYGKTVEEKRHLKEQWKLVKKAVAKGGYFISDQNWGAAFYFVRMGTQWRLLVVDTSDCSA